MRGFGETLASMRAARSMTQRELADRVGMSDITISRTERDASKPSNAKLLQIIAAMSVVMPLTESEMADLVALGMHAYLLTPYATMPPAAIEGSRRQCEALLNELLSGMDPKPVAQVLHALIALKNAKPIARPVHRPMPLPPPQP